MAENMLFEAHWYLNFNSTPQIKVLQVQCFMKIGNWPALWGGGPGQGVPRLRRPPSPLHRWQLKTHNKVVAGGAWPNLCTFLLKVNMPKATEINEDFEIFLDLIKIQILSILWFGGMVQQGGSQIWTILTVKSGPAHCKQKFKIRACTLLTKI